MDVDWLDEGSLSVCLHVKRVLNGGFNEWSIIEPNGQYSCSSFFSGQDQRPAHSRSPLEANWLSIDGLFTHSDLNTQECEGEWENKATHQVSLEKNPTRGGQPAKTIQYAHKSLVNHLSLSPSLSTGLAHSESIFALDLYIYACGSTKRIREKICETLPCLFLRENLRWWEEQGGANHTIAQYGGKDQCRVCQEVTSSWIVCVIFFEQTDNGIGCGIESNVLKKLTNVWKKFTQKI